MKQNNFQNKKESASLINDIFRIQRERGTKSLVMQYLPNN